MSRRRDRKPTAADRSTFEGAQMSQQHIANVPNHSDEHLGAVEGDRPTDRPQEGNPHREALDDQGLPQDEVAIAEDAIGARADESQG